MSVLYHGATGKGRLFRFANDKQAALASGEYVVRKPVDASPPRTGRQKKGLDSARLAEMAAYAEVLARGRAITHEQARRLAREQDPSRLPPPRGFW